MLRIVSGLCVAQVLVLGTGEHGVLMQSQANTEDLDSILFESGAVSERPKTRRHSVHGSHERSRARLMELQSNAQMLEQKYKAILHAKVVKAEKSVESTSKQNEAHITKRAANEWVPADGMFSSVDNLLQTIEDNLLAERTTNQVIIKEAKDVLIACNDKRREEFDLPRYMDYFFYRKTFQWICEQHTQCWDPAQNDWEKTRANIEMLEATQKVIWKALGKARCYVKHLKKTKPTSDDFDECVNLDPPTPVLNIVYDPEIVKDICDLCVEPEDQALPPGSRGSRAEDEAKLYDYDRVRHHNWPHDGIINSAKIMYEMIQSRGLTEQHAVEQEIVNNHTDDVNECNTIKAASWASRSIPDLNRNMISARGDHSGARGHEVAELTKMQNHCTAFRDSRNTCAETRDASTRASWAYWWSDHGGNASLERTIALGQTCWNEINRTNPISLDADQKQEFFQDEFCTYYKTKNQTCNEHDECWETEMAERAFAFEWVRKREGSLKLQHRLVEINLCFIALYQGSENATEAEEIDDAHLVACVNKDWDDTHLTINYPETDPKDECDRTDIQNYPGQDPWEEAEYSESPFTDHWNSMNAVEPCDFHQSSSLIQKMKPSRPRMSASVRSP